MRAVLFKNPSWCLLWLAAATLPQATDAGWFNWNDDRGNQETTTSNDNSNPPGGRVHVSSVTLHNKMVLIMDEEKDRFASSTPVSSFYSVPLPNTTTQNTKTHSSPFGFCKFWITDETTTAFVNEAVTTADLLGVLDTYLNRQQILPGVTVMRLSNEILSQYGTKPVSSLRDEWTRLDNLAHITEDDETEDEDTTMRTMLSIFQRSTQKNLWFVSFWVPITPDESIDSEQDGTDDKAKANDLTQGGDSPHPQSTDQNEAKPDSSSNSSNHNQNDNSTKEQPKPENNRILYQRFQIGFRMPVSQMKGRKHKSLYQYLFGYRNKFGFVQRNIYEQQEIYRDKTTTFKTIVSNEAIHISTMKLASNQSMGWSVPATLSEVAMIYVYQGELAQLLDDDNDNTEESVGDSNSSVPSFFSMGSLIELELLAEHGEDNDSATIVNVTAVAGQAGCQFLLLFGKSLQDSVEQENGVLWGMG